MEVEEFKKFIEEAKEEKRKLMEKQKDKRIIELFELVKEDLFSEMKQEITRDPDLKSIHLSGYDLAAQAGIEDVKEVFNAIVVKLPSFGYKARIVYIEDGDYESIEVSWDE